MPKYVGLAILVSWMTMGCTRSSVTQYTLEANVTSSPAVPAERHESSLLATRIIVDDGTLGDTTPTPNQGIETPETNPLAEWAEYSSNALQITFRYPPTWQVLEQGGLVYVYSDKTTDSGAKYFVYIEEYSNPQQQSLEQVIASRWGDDIAQDVQIAETVVGQRKVYETSDLPSAYGALTLFLEEKNRYIAISLTPYDSETETTIQRECVQVLHNLVGSITPEA